MQSKINIFQLKSNWFHVLCNLEATKFNFHHIISRKSKVYKTWNKLVRSYPVHTVLHELKRLETAFILFQMV